MEIYQVNKFLAFILPIQSVKSFPCIHLHDIQSPSVVPRICQDIGINAVHIKTQLWLLTLSTLEYVAMYTKRMCQIQHILKRKKKQSTVMILSYSLSQSQVTGVLFVVFNLHTGMVNNKHVIRQNWLLHRCVNVDKIASIYHYDSFNYRLFFLLHATCQGRTFTQQKCWKLPLLIFGQSNL